MFEIAVRERLDTSDQVVGWVGKQVHRLSVAREGERWMMASMWVILLCAG